MKVISEISGVRKIEAKGNVMHITTDVDLRTKIAEAVVKSDIPLVQMKIQEFSLDEIYMKYFHEE